MVLGWVVVAAYTAALVLVGVTTTDGSLRPGDRPDDGAAAARLIDAWERSRTATFLRSATFERRSEVTGAVISSEDVLAQRPPQRIHRQLGGVDGRDDDRLVVCAAPPAGETGGVCQLGAPGGPTYAEDVAEELADLRALLQRPDPLYAVADGDEDGCFELAQQRSDPRAPFGTEAQFCFDAATGAPTNSRVRYEGGIVEVVTVTEIEIVVTDGDLRP